MHLTCTPAFVTVVSRKRAYAPCSSVSRIAVLMSTGSDVIGRSRIRRYASPTDKRPFSCRISASTFLLPRVQHDPKVALCHRSRIRRGRLADEGDNQDIPIQRAGKVEVRRSLCQANSLLLHAPGGIGYQPDFPDVLVMISHEADMKPPLPRGCVRSFVAPSALMAFPRAAGFEIVASGTENPEFCVLHVAEKPHPHTAVDGNCLGKLHIPWIALVTRIDVGIRLNINPSALPSEMTWKMPPVSRLGRRDHLQQDRRALAPQACLVDLDEESATLARCACR